MLLCALLAFFETHLFPADDVVAWRYNPAQTPDTCHIVSCGIEERFLVADLRTYTLIAAVGPYKGGLSSYGNGSYRENVLDLGGSFPVTGALRAGVSVGLLHCWIRDHPSLLAYTIRCGGRFQRDRFTFDAWAGNLNVPRCSDSDYLPVTYQCSVNYRTSRAVSTDFQCTGCAGSFPCLRLRLAVRPHPLIELATGISTDPARLEGGALADVGPWSVRYQGDIHPQLGLSQSVSLQYRY